MITELDTAVVKIKSRNISGSHFPQCPFLKRALAPEIQGVSLHFTGACLVTADQGHAGLICAELFPERADASQQGAGSAVGPLDSLVPIGSD